MPKSTPLELPRYPMKEMPGTPLGYFFWGEARSLETLGFRVVLGLIGFRVGLGLRVG